MKAVEDFGINFGILSYFNQLLQLCTARTAWSEMDQAMRAVHSW